MFAPEMKIEKFEVMDVITTSVDTCDTDGVDCGNDLGLN